VIHTALEYALISACGMSDIGLPRLSVETGRRISYHFPPPAPVLIIVDRHVTA